MSRIPSLAKYTAPNNFIPQQFTFARDNPPYDDGLAVSICAPYTGISTLKINQINRETLNLYFEINDGGNGWPRLYYNIDAQQNYPIGLYQEVADTVDYLGFSPLNNGDSLSVPYGSKLSLAGLGRGCDDFAAAVSIYTYSGSTPSAQFLLDSFNLYDAAI